MRTAATPIMIRRYDSVTEPRKKPTMSMNFTGNFTQQLPIPERRPSSVPSPSCARGGCIATTSSTARCRRPSGTRKRVRGVHGGAFLSRLHVRRLRATDGATRLRRLALRSRCSRMVSRCRRYRDRGRGRRWQCGAGGDHRRPRHRHRRPGAQGTIQRGAGADALAHAGAYRRHGRAHGRGRKTSASRSSRIARIPWARAGATRRAALTGIVACYSTQTYKHINSGEGEDSSRPTTRT